MNGQLPYPALMLVVASLTDPIVQFAVDTRGCAGPRRACSS